MTLRIPLPAALPLCLAAAAALAAPPLSVPFPRPTPEQEARMVAESEEALRRAEIEEAYLNAGAADPSEPAAETSATPAETPAAAVEAPAPPPAPPAAPPAPPAVAPAPAKTPAPPAATPAQPANPKPANAKTAESANAATNDVFRRDPFWPVAVARQRKADHDARIAARIEAEKRAALIAKKRQEAIDRGEDVELLEDEIDDPGATAGPSGPAKRPSGSFGGATDEEWDAALAKLPPRSGYLGGRKPALILKGDKTPHYAGEKLCVTNRNVVFTWRIATVDFRAYTHELKRLKAVPVQGD